MSGYTNHMNDSSSARSQYPPGLGHQSCQRPAYVRRLPESQQYGSTGYDPQMTGGEFYNCPPPDPAQHSSGEESCFNDHRQFYSDSGPPPDSPQQIPAISEHSGFDGVKFQPPNSTRTNMSGSERPFPSHQNIIYRPEDRASSHENASSNYRESSSALHRQALGGQPGGDSSQRLLAPHDERPPPKRAPLSKAALNERILYFLDRKKTPTQKPDGREVETPPSPAVNGAISLESSEASLLRRENDELRASVAALQSQVTSLLAHNRELTAQMQSRATISSDEREPSCTARAATENGKPIQIKSISTTMGPLERPSPQISINVDSSNLMPIERNNSDDTTTSKMQLDSLLKSTESGVSNKSHTVSKTTAEPPAVHSQPPPDKSTADPMAPEHKSKIPPSPPTPNPQMTAPLPPPPVLPSALIPKKATKRSNQHLPRQPSQWMLWFSYAISDALEYMASDEINKSDRELMFFDRLW